MPSPTLLSSFTKRRLHLALSDYLLIYLVLSHRSFPIICIMDTQMIQKAVQMAFISGREGYTYRMSAFVWFSLKFNSAVQKVLIIQISTELHHQGGAKFHNFRNFLPPMVKFVYFGLKIHQPTFFLKVMLMSAPECQN